MEAETKIEYIRTKQAEHLIRILPLLESYLLSLQEELTLTHLKGRRGMLSDEAIFYALIGNKPLSDMPRSAPTPGDRMNNIVANKDKVLDHAYDETIIAITDELIRFKELVDKLHFALECLSENQQYIVKWFYTSGTSRKSWKELMADLNLAEATARKERDEAITKIITVSRITMWLYQYCAERVEVEEREKAE